MDHARYCSDPCHIKFSCGDEPDRRGKYCIEQLTSENSAGIRDECCKPGTDPILVWMEHSASFKKNPAAHEQSL